MKVRINVMLTIVTLATFILSCSSSSQPSVVFSFSDHDFGLVSISESSEVKLIISNKRSTILTLTKMTMTNYEFLLASGGTANTRVQPKSDHEVTIKFYPSLPGGIKMSTLTIEYNYGFDPLYKEILFKGTSVPIAKIEVNPRSTDYNALVINTTKTKDFLITNTGTATMNISNIQITGPAASEYSVIAGTSGPLSAATSMKVTVEFAPIVVGNPKDAVLQIFHNGLNYASPIDITLTGSGYDVPVFSVTPTSFDFGMVAKGDTATTKFTIENLGGADMNIKRIDVIGDYSVISGGTPLPVVIPPGSTHELEIEFKPTDYNKRNGEVSITSDTLTTPDKFTMSGEGFRGLPFEEDFESTYPGQIPANWKITTGPNSTTGGSTQYSWKVFSNGSAPDDNNTGGTGKYVAARSDKYSEKFDDYLESPPIDCTTYTTGSISFEFDGHFETYLNLNYELAAVEVYDGAAWQRLDDWDTTWTSTGVHKSFTVTQYARGNANFKIRFYYTTQYIYLYWFKIDNIKVSQ